MNATPDTDFYTWTQEQATLLRHGRFCDLDTVNLIEEIEDMGRSEKRELSSRFIILIAHLLKWQYQSERRCSSWRGTIMVQRKEIAKCLRENPSLKHVRQTTITDAYDTALWQAIAETGPHEAVFPTACPWTIEQVMDYNFWPSAHLNAS